ncbi:hypothetical protein Poli38472_003859 [Pythium oligandrum]|uniref:Lysosomal dipeptide transporter MFSD1 n=1 Tax=Pythium oligandrum TaxID=41045 RepID=A0A8K1CN11_PYTOL|nr:hypothetical protein Poli38472_003859 [Pythium oligandrum]|eukprot:TMW66094.1 hypothetical protein Poli38472_003859 [Pythium oligandrum]
MGLHSDLHAQDALAPRPARTLQKALVLFLCSALGFGSNYCFHNPAALKNQLQQHFNEAMGKNEYEVLFNLLYTLYSIPNIVLPFVGGFFVDRIGARQMLLLLTSFVLIGQLIMAFGSSILSFQTMLIGRIVFGFGGESLGVARTTFIATWFTKHELALALGISSSFSGLGGILNNVLSPYFSDQFGVSFALWFAAFTCGVSVIATLILIPVDRSAHAMAPHMLPNGQPRLEIAASAIKISDVKHFGLVFWLILTASVAMWGSVVPFQTVTGSLLLERDYFRRPPMECRRCGEGNYVSYADCSEIVPTCPSSPSYAWPLPKLSASCEIKRPIDQLYCSVSPPYILDSEINCDSLPWKNGPLTRTYCEKKIIAEEMATQVMSLSPLISLIGSPIFGYAVRNVRRRGIIALVASIIVVTSQMLVAASDISIGVILFAQGVGYYLFFAVIWPSIPYIVEEHHVGTAYGATIAVGSYP